MSVGLPVAMDSLNKIEAIIVDIGSDEPHKAYLIGKSLEKLGKRVTSDFSDGFKKYYDDNKELPGGFTCKISNRKSYNYEENEEWRKLKSDIEFLQEQIEKATNSNVTFPNPNTGLQISPVGTKNTEVYSITKK